MGRFCQSTTQKRLVFPVLLPNQPAKKRPQLMGVVFNDDAKEALEEVITCEIFMSGRNVEYIHIFLWL